MNNIIAVAVGEQSMCPHELAIITEAKPEFLPPATLAESEGRRALLYSSEGLVPVARYGEGPNGGRPATLAGLFDMLTGYIRCLLSARDMLLNTRLLSSDPETGVFVRHERAKVVAVWGADALADEKEKICRIAHALSGRERVMGAKTSMERMIEIIRSENPSLLNCLRAAESLCREWNHIAVAA